MIAQPSLCQTWSEPKLLVFSCEGSFVLFFPGIGSKKNPLHMLVVHGSISIRHPPKIDSSTLKDWFQTSGNVEGIVWHCENKQLFKVSL